MAVAEVLAQKVSVGRSIVDHAWWSITERTARRAHLRRRWPPAVEPVGDGIAG
jgi:hypothetical protein